MTRGPVGMGFKIALMPLSDWRLYWGKDCSGSWCTAACIVWVVVNDVMVNVQGDEFAWRTANAPSQGAWLF